MKSARIAWGGLARNVKGLGPGERTVVWVAGCRRRCPHCMTPELLRFQEPNIDVAAVVKLISASPDWNGLLSISGGEPFEQAASLYELLAGLQHVGLSETLIYSGYTLEQLQRLGGARTRLLELTDILIDGVYRHDLPQTLPWRGSDNQRVHLLSPRVQGYRAFADTPSDATVPLGIQPIPDVGFRLIVIPRSDFFKRRRDTLTANQLTTANHDNKTSIHPH